MTIVISGIPIDIHKKRISRICIFRSKPPEGHVVISAPASIDDKAIEIYARTNLIWIKNRLKSFNIRQEALNVSM